MKKYTYLVLLTVILTACKDQRNVTEVKINSEYNTLKTALTFYASFDNGVNADFSKGNGNLYSVNNRKALDSAVVGLHKESVTISKGNGKFGDALHYADKSKGYIYYPSKDNISYSKTNWSGAISFWLSLDPNTDLKPGYCDPIQITDSGYNDAGIWVDFTKKTPRDFRLGVIGDRDYWNPNPEGPDNENHLFNKQLITAKNPPFKSGEWTHILINFSNLNTKKGKTELYVNGKYLGARLFIEAPFTWELEKSNIFLGLSYIGLIDELSIYNKALSKEEISELQLLNEGVKSIL